MKSDVSMSKFQFRFGTNYFGTTCESNTRLELTPGQAPVATHRNYIKKGALYYGAVASLNLQTLALLRYDGLLGYVNSKYEANLKHESDSKASKVSVSYLLYFIDHIKETMQTNQRDILFCSSLKWNDME